MEDTKPKTLLKSRKALEYRVYWLERKLTFLRDNEKRDVNSAKIECLPASPIKELMHLNNEFQRANEQAQALKNLTEELNKDALRINERSEHTHEISLAKITAAERLNRQSRRLQKRTGEINKEMVLATDQTRTIFNDSKDALQNLNAQIEESVYLSNLTRAQHTATDNLNSKTRSLNLEALKATTSSLHLNRQLTNTRQESRQTNRRTRELQQQLKQLKAELTNLNTESKAIHQQTEERLIKLDEIKGSSLETIERADDSIDRGFQQLERGEELFVRSTELNDHAAQTLERLHELRKNLSADVAALKRQTNLGVKEFTESQRTNIDKSLRNSRHALNEAIHSAMTECRSELDKAAEQAEQKLSAVLAQTDSNTQRLVQNSSEQLASQIKQNTLLTNEILDAIQHQSTLELHCFQEASQSGLARFENESRKSLTSFSAKTDSDVAEFQRKSDDSLVHFSTVVSGFIDGAAQRVDKIDDTIDSLAQKIVKNLEQSEDFLEQTASANGQSTLVLDESRELNVASLDLQEQCQQAIGQIESTLGEVNRVGTKLKQETGLLQRQTRTLNDESKKLNKSSEETTNHALNIQNESIKSQELSQEINSHSLALHEESRNIIQDFEHVKHENTDLVSHLVELREHLTQQYQQHLDQYTDSVKSLQMGEESYAAMRELRAETRRLNQQTSDVVQHAKQAIVQTENLHRSSSSLSDEIQQSHHILEKLQNEVEEVNTESRQATTEAMHTIQESEQLHEKLILSANNVEDLQRETAVEMVSLQQIKSEACESAQKSDQAYQELRLCIDESRQINDEFMRGLESTTEAHKITEDKAQSLLAESQVLQSEIREMLSLRTGFREFQATIDDCRTQVDKFAQDLSTHQKDSKTQHETLQDCQSRMEDYQTNLHRYGDSVAHFENRARKLENHLTDHNLRLKELENFSNTEYENRLSEHVEKVRILEIEIRGELKSKQLKFNDDLNALRHSLGVSVERMGHELADHLNGEISRTTERVASTDRSLSNLSAEFMQLNQSVTAEVSTLREENQEVRERNRELQRENHRVQTEQKQKIATYDLAQDEVDHRLDNLQKLMEDQIDRDQNYEFTHRISILESNIESQRLVLENHESFQTDVTEQLNSQSGNNHLNELVSRFDRKLELATETNMSLKSAISSSEKTNRELLDGNNQLQRKLQASLKDRETIMQQYANRIGKLEEHEQEYQQTITNLASRESDTNQTLQQMRLAMKDSTRAIRETQKTLEKFQTRDKSKKRTWIDNSKQAIVSSFVAVLFTSLTIFGFEKVDASINSVATQASPVYSQLLSRSEEDTLGSLIRDGIAVKTAVDSHQNEGEFSWPVFGIVESDAIRYERNRRGISISAEIGDPVVAVNDGIVIYSANELRGYGNIILIQHKENLVSVYANNQFNYVKKGDTVRRGQLIGDIGQLFNENQAGLYFEMRYMGMPEDPFNYLKKRVERGQSKNS